MAKNFGPTIKKLQRAINEKYDKKILINKTQFFSENTGKPVEIIVIKQAQWDANKQRNKNVELFSSASDVQIVLWLRDYWYELEGLEIPTDNEKWNKAKAAYNEKHIPSKDNCKIGPDRIEEWKAKSKRSRKKLDK